MESKQQPPYPLRMPQDMRSHYEDLASAHGRSLNAEILSSLAEVQGLRNQVESLEAELGEKRKLEIELARAHGTASGYRDATNAIAASANHQIQSYLETSRAAMELASYLAGELEVLISAFDALRKGKVLKPRQVTEVEDAIKRHHERGDKIHTFKIPEPEPLANAVRALIDQNKKASDEA